MQEPNNETFLVDFFKNLFTKKRVIKAGDTGIFQDVFTIDSINDGTHPLKCDIYAKVKAIAIYDNLIEIEIINILTLNSCNDNIKEVITSIMPKYVKPKYIKWEVK